MQFKIFIIFNKNSDGMLNFVHLKLHFQCKTRSTFAYDMTVTLQVCSERVLVESIKCSEFGGNRAIIVFVYLFQ